MSSSSSSSSAISSLAGDNYEYLKEHPNYPVSIDRLGNFLSLDDAEQIIKIINKKFTDYIFEWVNARVETIKLDKITSARISFLSASIYISEYFFSKDTTEAFKMKRAELFANALKEREIVRIAIEHKYSS